MTATRLDVDHYECRACGWIWPVASPPNAGNCCTCGGELVPVDENDDEIGATGPTEWWRKHGYLAGKEIGGGLWIVMIKMLFTYRVAICDRDSIMEFYCYEDLDLAVKAFTVWDGTGEVPPGFTKHHAPPGNYRERIQTKGE